MYIYNMIRGCQYLHYIATHIGVSRIVCKKNVQIVIALNLS